MTSASPGGRGAGTQLCIAAVEPYCGGSHAHFLRGLSKYSQHRIELFALPARLWKWRLRGAALNLARALNAHAGFDLLLCSDFVNVPDLRALLAPELRVKPLLYYLHENQLSYPLSPNEELDPYFGFTNVLSCLSADAVVFNSEFHRREFLQHLPAFLPRLPDYDPSWVVDVVTRKAEVLPLGLDLEELERLRPPDAPEPGARPGRQSPPRLLWNHRWEFDKCPERFFGALEVLAGRDVAFRVDVLGESFQRRPAVFDAARERLGARVGQFGFADRRRDYVRYLYEADVVVSTARQEFFGISMAEAVSCGAHPIAPRALVYEDLYGGFGVETRLYRDDAELVRLIERALVEATSPGLDAVRAGLLQFDWRAVAPRFDARFAALAAIQAGGR